MKKFQDMKRFEFEMKQKKITQNNVSFAKIFSGRTNETIVREYLD